MQTNLSRNSIAKQCIHALFLFVLLLLLLCSSATAKGGGGGGRGGGGFGGGGSHSSSFGSFGSRGSRNSRTFAFFYYNDDGRRTCGGVCIVTISAIVIGCLIALICVLPRICASCCSRRKNKHKYDNKYKFNLASPPALYPPINSSSGSNNNVKPTFETPKKPVPAKKNKVAPFPNASISETTLVDSEDRHHTVITMDDTPPSYDTTLPAPEPIHIFGLKHEASWEAHEAAEEFTRKYPPQEQLPTTEHVDYVRKLGTAAWQFVPEPSVAERVSAKHKGRLIQFTGKRDTMVQTNYPFFTSDSSKAEKNVARDLYYFEITILSNSKPKDTTIAIGLSTKPYPSFRLPGWNNHSVGYHSDDGHKFNDSFGGRDYGPTWGKVGDTIGCGYYAGTGFVFFTKNGKFLGNAFTGMRHVWYPTVGADGPCQLEVNFGDDGSRHFRLEEARGYGPGGPICT